MKKAFVWMLTLIVLAGAAWAGAEPAQPFFERLEGVEWSFSSGAGGWSTDMRILPDGSFSGEYHDSEMGESAEAYPEGTVYCCSFSGRMSLAEQLDEHTWKIRVDALGVDESQAAEEIEGGIRYVFAEPYGISAGDEMLLFAPGAPVDGFTEDMKFWAHLIGAEESVSTLEGWFLYSERNESGFVGFKEESVLLPNPWEEVTEERLREVSGLSFGVPEGAENVVRRWNGGEGLAEMQFDWEGGEFCARAQTVEAEKGEMTEISGMYFAWDDEEEITVRGCPGIIGTAQTGSEDWVERCLWLDEAAGIQYALSVCANDLDGLDLVAIAEQVYRPGEEA